MAGLALHATIEKIPDLNRKNYYNPRIIQKLIRSLNLRNQLLMMVGLR